MCRPIRGLSEARGFKLKDHVLACFGGAGAQHACAIARELGMKRIVVHAYAGILSAYGLGLADVVVDKQVPVALRFSEASVHLKIKDRCCELEKEAIAELKRDGFGDEQVRTEKFLNLRYEGTDNAIMTAQPADGDYQRAMSEVFKREYGFVLSGSRELLIDDIRVRAVGATAPLQRRQLERCAEEHGNPSVREYTCVYFRKTGWVEAPVFQLSELLAGHAVVGPAIIMERTSTIVIEPCSTAHVAAEGDLIIELDELDVQPMTPSSTASAAAVPEPVDPIMLSVFANRFMSIAEQMGHTLQRTAISVNIKERLDFSCAIFGGDCGLVANAPHVPVHLGAMADTVRAQVSKLAGRFAPGDVIVANDPTAGGSHLPDITVITPVFAADLGVLSLSGWEGNNNNKPLFFCASRGHHADVGGSTPGSMPADSTSLAEEGAVINAFLLVKQGVFDEEGIIDLLNEPARRQAPSDKPGMKLAACRNMTDVVSDLKAQVAANAKGISLLHELMRVYSQPVVVSYMAHVQANAADCVRSMLREYAQHLSARCEKRTGSSRTEAEDLPEEEQSADGDRAPITMTTVDYMDDGNPICLQLTIDPVDCTAHFDFTGTGPQVYGNWNSPVAVTTAAVIYCLRILVGRDIPLNSGFLEPVRITIPEGSMLRPAPDAAVCAGNVLTSMRITDVILRAFGACAASQGCMNNFAFGDEKFGYYETIAGGAGAGPDWAGTSAVQCHMTNTRMTDVEILEKRYPVLVKQFSVRRGSGGAGEYAGGDGVVREIEFLRGNIIASLLTERRSFAPYGMAGGADGQRGKNLLLRRTGNEGIDRETTASQLAASHKLLEPVNQHTYQPAQSGSNAHVTPLAGSDCTTIALGSKCKFTLNKGDTVRVALIATNALSLRVWNICFMLLPSSYFSCLLQLRFMLVFCSCKSIANHARDCAFLGRALLTLFARISGLVLTCACARARVERNCCSFSVDDDPTPI
ncbi:unnamed protein product [Polarella glacialis]|uniref:5-oxoprolinase n=1 Tax=Polarella glacialis TaxID=89957 RepID=A0A813H0R0_POLGL|nr:unnamed protein product [Polarella glacialis]